MTSISPSCWCQVIDSEQGETRTTTKRQNFSEGQAKASRLLWWIISRGIGVISDTVPGVCSDGDWYQTKGRRVNWENSGIVFPDIKLSIILHLKAVSSVLKHWQCFGARWFKRFSWFSTLWRKSHCRFSYHLKEIFKYQDQTSSSGWLSLAIPALNKSTFDFPYREADPVVGQCQSDEAKLSENARSSHECKASHPPGSVSRTHSVLIPFASLTTGLPELQHSVTNGKLPLIHILLDHCVCSECLRSRVRTHNTNLSELNYDGRRAVKPIYGSVYVSSVLFFNSEWAADRRQHAGQVLKFKKTLYRRSWMTKTWNVVDFSLTPLNTRAHTHTPLTGSWYLIHLNSLCMLCLWIWGRLTCRANNKKQHLSGAQQTALWHFCTHVCEQTHKFTLQSCQDEKAELNEAFWKSYF